VCRRCSPSGHFDDRFGSATFLCIGQGCTPTLQAKGLPAWLLGKTGGAAAGGAVRVR
jgi:hypothetical protein